MAKIKTLPGMGNPNRLGLLHAMVVFVVAVVVVVSVVVSAVLLVAVVSILSMVAHVWYTQHSVVPYVFNNNARCGNHASAKGMGVASPPNATTCSVGK